MWTNTSKKECDDAAKILGLLARFANELQDPATPHGCTFGNNDWFRFASTKGHPYANILCGCTDHKSDYECILQDPVTLKTFVYKFKTHIMSNFY